MMVPVGPPENIYAFPVLVGERSSRSSIGAVRFMKIPFVTVEVPRRDILIVRARIPGRGCRLEISRMWVSHVSFLSRTPDGVVQPRELVVVVVHVFGTVPRNLQLVVAILRVVIQVGNVHVVVVGLVPPQIPSDVIPTSALRSIERRFGRRSRQIPDALPIPRAHLALVRARGNAADVLRPPVVPLGGSPRQAGVLSSSASPIERAARRMYRKCGIRVAADVRQFHDPAGVVVIDGRPECWQDRLHIVHEEERRIL